MSTMEPSKVLTSAEARTSLGSVMKRYRSGGSSSPVVFGSHRKPEAVILPYDEYERMLGLLEDAEIASTVRERIDAGEPEQVELGELFERVGLDRQDT